MVFKIKSCRDPFSLGQLPLLYKTPEASDSQREAVYFGSCLVGFVCGSITSHRSLWHSIDTPALGPKGEAEVVQFPSGTDLGQTYCSYVFKVLECPETWWAGNQGFNTWAFEGTLDHACMFQESSWTDLNTVKLALAVP